MTIQRRLGMVFIAFSVLVFLYNSIALIMSFQAPDFDTIFNIFSCAAYAFLFGMSIIREGIFGKIIQASTLAIEAFLTVKFGETPFFGLAILVVDICLIFAYGWFRTRPIYKLILTGVIVLAIMIFALQDTHVLSTIRAIMWAIFVYIFCFLLWLIFKDLILKYHKEDEKLELDLIGKITRLISINEELVDIVKDIVKRSDNGSKS